MYIKCTTCGALFIYADGIMTGQQALDIQSTTPATIKDFP